MGGHVGYAAAGIDRVVFENGFLKVEKFDIPGISPPETVKFEDLLRDEDPAILWEAKCMVSASTGMRPRGESMKLFGSWWRIDKITQTDISVRLAERALLLDNPASVYADDMSSPFRRKRVTVLEALSRAISAAVRSGMAREQIVGMVDTEIVAETMED